MNYLLPKTVSDRCERDAIARQVYISLSLLYISVSTSGCVQFALHVARDRERVNNSEKENDVIFKTSSDVCCLTSELE